MNAEVPDLDAQLDEQDIEGDGDDIVAQVKGSRRDMRMVGRNVLTLTQQVARSRVAIGLLGFALILSVVAIGVGGVALVKLRAQNACLRVVVGANADRIGVLSPAATKRTKADRALNVARDDLLTLAIRQSPREELIAASDSFVKAKAADDLANAEYDAKAAAIPLPPNPAQACP